MLTHWPIMGDGVHAEGQLLLGVLVELLPHCKGFGDHLALLDPLGFIVTAANDPGRETKVFLIDLEVVLFFNLYFFMFFKLICANSMAILVTY